MMIKIKRVLLALLMVALTYVTYSCNNFSNTVLGSQKQDTIIDKLDEDFLARPVLYEKWDSLRKNLISFKVDSLNPIKISVQKKLLKDSLRKEFNKKPKHIYLTFDDGPLVGSKFLDTLSKSKNIKISVFIVGKHASMGNKRLNDLNSYIQNPLVSVYNHSYSHGLNKFQLFYSDSLKAFADFKKNEAEVHLSNKIARLPGRNIWMYDDQKKIDIKNAEPTANLLYKDGYKIFGWDVEWRINSKTGVPNMPLESVYSKIVNFMNNKSSMEPNNIVFLMHDDMFQTQSARNLLSNLIDKLIDKGYSFESMEDYPKKH